MKTDRIKLLLAVSIVLTFLSGMITYYANWEGRGRVNRVFHTHEVINQGNEVLSLLKDIETGQRGYLITNDTGYLKTYELACHRLPDAVDSLARLVSDNPTQTTYLSTSIIPLIEQKKAIINKTLAIHYRSGIDSSHLFLKNNSGKILMDSLRYHLGHFKATELNFLNERLSDMNNTLDRQNLTRYVSFVLIALVSLVAFITLDKQQKQNDTLIRKLQQANETLEQKVQDRTRELAVQNRETLELNEELRQNMEEMESFYEALQIRSIKAEDTLKEIRDLYDNAPCGYHSLAPDGTIIRINERELTWLGYTRDEVIGKMNITEVVIPEEHPSYYRDFARFIELGFIANKDHTFVRKDGSTFSVILNSIAIYDEPGKYKMSRGTIIDVTDRKRVEQELMEANRNLVRLNEEKNHFLAIAAHDLRSPINRIFGLINLATSSDNLTAEQHEYGKYIRGSCTTMLTLITNLLDVNKIEQGIAMINLQSVEVKGLIHSLLVSFREQARSKSISLQLESVVDDHFMVTDSNALERILENLLSNAIKFSPKDRSVVLRVSRNHETIKFEVIDQGQGIGEKDLSNLFKKFQKLEARPTNGESSTGLGLYIVKELVQSLHGKISVTSTVNKGSTFVVELPVS